MPITSRLLPDVYHAWMPKEASMVSGGGILFDFRGGGGIELSNYIPTNRIAHIPTVELVFVLLLEVGG